MRTKCNKCGEVSLVVKEETKCECGGTMKDADMGWINTQ